MSTKKIILTVGIPASSKSTWAKKFVQENTDYVRVCRDDYRLMLANAQGLDPKGENFVSKLVYDAIYSAIEAKYNVIVDQTNVNIKYLNKMVSFCEKFANVEFRIFDIPLETAIKRDEAREAKVGRAVIERMYKNYLDLFNSNFDFSSRKKKDYIVDNISYIRVENKDAVVFDIDGTIAHAQGKRNIFDWDNVDADVVDQKMRETIRSYKKNGFKIIFVTGRDGLSREKTTGWLNNNKVPFDFLFMKGENDFRKDTLVKTEIYKNEIEPNFNVLCVYEDRSRVVSMWRDLGVKCYQVDDGRF